MIEEVGIFFKMFEKVVTLKRPQMCTKFSLKYEMCTVIIQIHKTFLNFDFDALQMSCIVCHLYKNGI